MHQNYPQTTPLAQPDRLGMSLVHLGIIWIVLWIFAIFADWRLACYLMVFRRGARANAAGRGHALRFTYEMRHLTHGKEDRTQNGARSKI